MTSGERMVWAAEFVRARGAGELPATASQLATKAVGAMRIAREQLKDLVARADLDEMLDESPDAK